jgi:glycerol-3-phosphate dehydrogenase (NAD(P)+)
MTKLGIALGGKPETFLGLAGVGDLMLTASSTKSRNFTVGFRLGSGEKLEDIIRSLGSVAEGVKTAKAAYELFKLRKIDSPIIEEMYNVLYMEKPIEIALKDLLWREASVELFLKRNSSPSS